MISDSPNTADIVEATALAERLGPAQQRVVLALGEEWGPSPCYETAKRMWHGVTGRGVVRKRGPIYIIDHKHLGGNSWRLNPLGLALQDALKDHRKAQAHD